MPYSSTTIKCPCGAVLVVETDDEKFKNHSIKEWLKNHKKCGGKNEND